MRAMFGVWGVPEYGKTLLRSRVVKALDDRAPRPILIYGSSGSGKSIAAAQYAETHSEVFWVDMGGASILPATLAALIAQAVQGECVDAAIAVPDHLGEFDTPDALSRVLLTSGRSRPSCFVLDDFGSDPPLGTFDGLAALLRTIWHARCQLVITTRSLDGWPTEALHECGIVGPEMLALTERECVEYLGIIGGRDNPADSRVIFEQSHGHCAFFTLLACHVLTHGEAECAVGTPMTSWLDRIFQVDLPAQARGALVAASYLRTGCESELTALGISEPRAAMSILGARLPLFSVDVNKFGRADFRVHDLVDTYLLEFNKYSEVDPDSGMLRVAISLLTDRGDAARAGILLSRLNDSRESLEWLLAHGEDLLVSQQYQLLGQLITSVPISKLMSAPRAVILWAQLAAETGDYESALSRCQAARLLSANERDVEGTEMALDCSLLYLRRISRHAEARALATEVLGNDEMRSRPILAANALVCLALGTLHESASEAEKMLGEANNLLRGLEGKRAQAMRQVVQQGLGLTCSYSGDFVLGSRRASRQAAEPHNLLSSRIAARGNFAVCLCELGRLARCESILRATLVDIEASQSDVFAGAYLPVLGSVQAARGYDFAGTSLIREGIRRAAKCSDELAVGQARVYLAVVLRAAGQLDESLSEAERAFEKLLSMDDLLFRVLSALEVAASLLALGDIQAATRWVESARAIGIRGNPYVNVRADMILAEVDRLEGRLDDAVDRLAQHAEYIRSENPNWQIAMYARAFPALLGMLCMAVGPGSLPAHMLRMVPPRDAERSLLVARGFMPQEEWRALGKRLLGESEFSKFLARDGLPLCHVRMFGGLEVSVGSKTVRERDWRKRKARLLFAMLVCKRGQDVPRDQVFEYLWPEMDPERAKNNLYVIWSTMKSVLAGDSDNSGKSPYVESVGGVCRTVRDNVRSDLDAFEEMLAEAKTAEVNGDIKSAAGAYERIAELYRGDLLPGDVYDDWFLELREHYRIVFVDSMLRASRLLMDADDPDAALVFVRKAIQRDSLREDLYQCALRCQIAAGQRSAAIDTYFQCRARLDEELGLDPSPETRALYQEILAMEPIPPRPERESYI